MWVGSSSLAQGSTKSMVSSMPNSLLYFSPSQLENVATNLGPLSMVLSQEFWFSKCAERMSSLTMKLGKLESVKSPLRPLPPLNSIASHEPHISMISRLLCLSLSAIMDSGSSLLLNDSFIVLKSVTSILAASKSPKSTFVFENTSIVITSGTSFPVLDLNKLLKQSALNSNLENAGSVTSLPLDFFC